MIPMGMLYERGQAGCAEKMKKMQTIRNREGAPKKSLQNLLPGSILPVGIKKGFGMQLRAIREKKGLTQVEIAEKAGISQEYVTRLETGGKKNPSLAVAVRLAKALGVSIADLVE